MAYSRSIPLERRLGARREAIKTLAAAHAVVGEVDGPGRPLEIGRPAGPAHVLRVVIGSHGTIGVHVRNRSLVNLMADELRVGATVRVPWGLDDVEGKIVEIWGDPPAHVRVRLHLEGDDETEPLVLLLAPSALTAA